jgi:hypothetical protein
MLASEYHLSTIAKADQVELILIEIFFSLHLMCSIGFTTLNRNQQASLIYNNENDIKVEMVHGEEFIDSFCLFILVA